MAWAPPSDVHALLAGRVPAETLAPARLKVLVVDDEPLIVAQLRALLEKRGFEVVGAGGGTEAVALFMREQPDMVLMDVLMPDVDGLQAAQHIRDLCGDDFVPLLFVTAASDDDLVARCIQAGGNDFIPKPINPVVLSAKVEAFAQLARLYRTVKQQRDALAQHNRWLTREYTIAEDLFGKIMHSGALAAPNIKYLASPQAIFNGDLLLAAWRPTGELHLLMGDFTGHGLSAAIGTIPVADMFNGMTAKGFGIPEIVAEINLKLQRVLPRGLFLAAAVLELDAQNRTLSVWNGGLPDVLVYDAARRRIAHRFSSRAFPLGVMETDRLDCAVETVEVASGDRIYVYTDGLPEARNAAGEMFSQARLERCFGDGYAPEALFERLQWELAQFRGGGQKSDDVTLIELTVDPALRGQSAHSEVLAPRPASEWSARFEFSHDTLKHHDPLPTMMQVLLDTQRLHQHKQRIYMVLAELFLNALEHGLLRLDSGLKERAGFGAYYQEKATRLARLTEGWIRVEFRHGRTHEGGRLTIRVEDSGPGFDFQRQLRLLDENQTVHGRGILLIRSLCASLRYAGRGNCAEAVYAWATDPGAP